MKEKQTKNNAEINKLKELIKEKDRIIEEHNMEVDKIRMNQREAENTLKSKLDDIQFQTLDLRCSQDKFASHLQMQNKNYEETIEKMKDDENMFKNEIKQLKSIIKKINNKNHSSPKGEKSPLKEKSLSKSSKSIKSKPKIKCKQGFGEQSKERIINIRNFFI